MVRFAACTFVGAAIVDPTDALTTARYWHTITMRGKCLATTEGCWLGDGGDCDLWNGAEVILWDCDDEGYNKWFINLDFSNPSTPFDIRAGNQFYDPTAAFSHNSVSDWCLDGGDIDAESSLLSVWECNGLPQQQFNADGIDPKYSFQGAFSFGNGKCLDGTESTAPGPRPLAWECNGQDQQIWDVHMCSMFCGPHPDYYCDTVCDCPVRSQLNDGRWSCSSDDSQSAVV